MQVQSMLNMDGKIKTGNGYNIEKIYFQLKNCQI